MAIRLNKVIKDLNVGVQTIAEFLQKKGFEIEADNPNAKITDEQYDLLCKEFKKDVDFRKETERLRQERTAKNRRPATPAKAETEKIDDATHSSPKQQEAENLIPTSIPEEAKPKVKTVGKIDLEQLNKPHAPEKQAEPKQEPEKAPEQTEKTAATNTQNPSNEMATPTAEPSKEEPEKPQQEEEIFKIRPNVQSATHINIVGKIDLGAINQSTRPKKKSKEEKRKEREEKDRNRNKPAATAAPQSAEGENRRKKRSRINKERVDINNIEGTNPPSNKRKQQDSSTNAPANAKNRHGKGGANSLPPKPTEVSDEDVAKQVKETLARLTNKGKTKSSKYRKEKRENVHNRMQQLETEELAESKVLKLTEFVTANELATMMNVPVTNVISTCMSIGMMVSINQRLDAEAINLVAEEYGFKTEYISADVAQAVVEEADKEEDLQPRPPIVTVMGHVDHGKTSLLDYIRKSNVIAGEAGGITQHIGAYNVKLDDGRRITFLDTPGHEAFTAMRARGAKVTDIAIIIVAADDDVMPQTKEAINHASAAGVPIVFAINKIDKPNANPDKIKEALGNMNYLVEEWGGKYQSQDISAKKGTGVHELLEKVLLEAEMLDLKANPNRKATGSIIESTLDKGRGYVATILVSNGTLKVGDIVLAGTHYGRIKAMFNERNQRIQQAGPSEPALILGLNGAPQAGDTFHVMGSEQEARELATKREQLQREQGLRTHKTLTLDELGRRIALGDFKELNIIVKGDVDGSIEALSDSLIKLSTERIQVNVIHKAVGQISESDVSLAAASNAIIVGFQVRPSAAARKQADQEGVDIRTYSIIYDAIEEIKAAMEGMLAPELKEQVTATVEVREVFHISKVGFVAGGVVKEGKVKRTDKARLIRDGIVIYTGQINALKRFKDDVKEVPTNFECGISLTNCNDLQVGDIIETFEEIEIKQSL
ncbi:MAG: translation initiation factor IF-2 [Bacteroidaceae bacterium]|jgi:translation initiation factor IF-2